MARPEPRAIVVVHPTAKVRNMLEATLRLKDYHVVKAADAEEALQEVQRQSPDLVLSEVDLPGMSGFELLARVRGYPPTAATPVVLIGGREDPREVARGLRMGAEDYLRKPFSIDELLVRLEKIFAHLERERASMSRSHLEGRLEKLPLTRLLKLLAEQRWTGRLTLHFDADGSQATLSIRQGQYAGGDFGYLKEEMALFQALLRPQGRFAFDHLRSVPSTPGREVHGVDALLDQARHLIAERHLRRIDVTDRRAAKDFELSMIDLLLQQRRQPAVVPPRFASRDEDSLDPLETSIEIEDEEESSDAGEDSSVEFPTEELDDEIAALAREHEAIEAASASMDDAERSSIDPMISTASLVIEAPEDADASQSIIIVAGDEGDTPPEGLSPASDDDDLWNEEESMVALVEEGPGPVERLYQALTAGLLGAGGFPGIEAFQICTRSGRVLASSVEDRDRREVLAAFGAQAIQFATRTDRGTFAAISANDLHLLVVELPLKRLLVSSFDNPPRAEAFLHQLGEIVERVD